MSTLKSKEYIGIVLMIIAIILLLAHSFQLGRGDENNVLQYSSWAALAVALTYKYWLSKKKKELNS